MKITAKQIIFFSLAVLLLFGLVAGIWIWVTYTNGGTEKFKTFTVEVDGELVVAEKSERCFQSGEHTVNVSYLFDTVAGEDYDYTVAIKSKPGIALDYTVNGETYPFGDLKELNAAFGLNKKADGFTFTVPAGLKAVLAAIYPGKTVTAPAGSELADKYLYELTIASYNGQVVYTIDFAITIPVQGVETDHGAVQFP